MPEHLVWPVWRLFLRKQISPYEVERYWSVEMVLDANDALDLEEAVERLTYKKAAQEREKNGPR